MKHLRIILTAGFAMFSMFFGAGNLVFPLNLGKVAGDHYLIAFAGLFITAVIVPFCGLLAMILFAGDRKAFFAPLGPKPAFLLTFLMLLLIGPFGAIPRCITVAYGSVKVAFPEFPFALYCFLFCAIIALLIWNKSRVVEIIGVYLTPWKLGGIVILILAGLFTGSQPLATSQSYSENFVQGTLLGYHTMDLIAAFFFSATIVSYLHDHLTKQDTPHILTKLSLISSSIGAGILAVAYTGFVIMGARHSIQFADVRAEELLTVISGYSLGSVSTIVVSLTLTVACLATATILSELCVDFLSTDVTKGRLTYTQSLFITSSITFAIALLGFAQISHFLGSILAYTYPALIAFTLASIFDKLSNRQTAGKVFWAVIVIFAGYALLCFIAPDVKLC